MYAIRSYYAIARTIGVFSMIFGLTLLVPIMLAVGYGEFHEIPNFLIPLAGSVGLGGTLWLIGRREPANLGTRDGFLIVVLFWVLLSVLGAWPLMISTDLKPLDALFEAVSGVTTTGATVITSYNFV